MSVIPLTVFGSLALAGLFVLLFALQYRRRAFGSIERDSLLPLAEERALPLAGPGAAALADEDAGCGCHDGSRPPCPGCLRQVSRHHHG